MLVSSCGRKETDEVVPFMHDLPKRLVVVFQKEADPREIFSFLEQHTNSPTPHPTGGFPLRPGIGALQKIRIQGHDGYEIGFYPNVTADQIAAIREEMVASSLVYGIYEDVDPEEIVFEPSSGGP